MFSTPLRVILILIVAQCLSCVMHRTREFKPEKSSRWPVIEGWEIIPKIDVSMNVGTKNDYSSDRFHSYDIDIIIKRDRIDGEQNVYNISFDTIYISSISGDIDTFKTISRAQWQTGPSSNMLLRSFEFNRIFIPPNIDTLLVEFNAIVAEGTLA
ncbi:MAG: hypothetical protein GY841_20860, partial [FCB group bacterium]|nr:hypothetical protein [FCB group bacterium]